MLKLPLTVFLIMAGLTACAAQPQRPTAGQEVIPQQEMQQLRDIKDCDGKSSWALFIECMQHKGYKRTDKLNKFEPLDQTA